MSAPESVALAVPVEEVKTSDATSAVETPAEPKVDEPVVAEVVTHTAEVTPTTEVVATEEVAIEETTKAVEGETKKDSPSKGTSFLTKILSSISSTKSKGEKKTKSSKSPKKEKKKEEVEAPATEEAPKEAVAEATDPVKEESAQEESAKEEPTKEEPAKEATEPAEGVEAAIGNAVTEEVKEIKEAAQKEEKKVLKVGRRLSARVGDLFKSKPKADIITPAKVDEHPPMIEHPMPVAPLEVDQAAKAIETSAPVVTATA